MKYSFLSFIFLLISATAFAQQGRSHFTIAYKAAKPVGSFKDVVSNNSINGFEASIMYGLSDQLSLGGQVGFQDFYQKYSRKVYNSSGSDISAVISQSLQAIPLMAKVAYSFSPEATIRPYAALAAGGSLIQQRTFWGQFSQSQSGFGFTVQPEAGIHVPIGQAKRTQIMLAAAYQYAPFKKEGFENANHALLKAGVRIPMR